MAEHHMSAREAWELARGGMPSLSGMVAYPVSGERYARACAIVEACVKEHEAFCAWRDTPSTPEADAARNYSALALDGAIEAVRALERGEELT